jgi:phage gp29-like protein
MARPNFDEIAKITRDLNYAYIAGYKRLIGKDDILALKGGGDLKLYETVAQDDQVKSCVQQRISAVISRDWGVEPGDDSKPALAAADFIEQELKNLQWDRINEKMLWGSFYGYSVGEIMWRRGDKIGIADIKVRNRRRFNFGTDLQPKLITLGDPLGEDLPDQKFWHFCCGGDNDDDPYGRGLAHWLYWPTFFKRSDMRWWVTFLEKYAQPTRLGKYSPGASESDKDTLWQAMDAFGTNGKMMIPEGTMIELLEAARAGGADYQGMLDICNAAISKIVLSQTMTTDNGSSESQANVHQDVKDDIVKADADLVCSSFNEGPVKWLIDWNFPGVAYPRVWRQMDAAVDLTAEADRDTKLQGLGISLKPESIAAKYGDDYLIPDNKEQIPQLNSEQVNALVSIVSQAKQGGWSPELVAGMINGAFPNWPDEAVAAITKNLGDGKPVEPVKPNQPVDLNAVSAQFAAPPKKKNCKSGISCGNACISALKTCKKPLTDEQKQMKVLIVASAGVEVKAKAKAKANPDITSDDVNSYIDKIIADNKPQGGKISEDLKSKLLDLADGANPDSIKISSEDVEHARQNFMDSQSNKLVGNKTDKIKAEGRDLSDDEALALSTWIGSNYTSMNAILYGGELEKGVDRQAVETTDLLAAKALHKLSPVTQEQITSEAKKKKEEFDPKAPLGRYMKVDNPAEFVKKYQDALKGDGSIRESTLFATSHIPRKDFSFCDHNTNLTYEVKPKLDGTGNGRYIDHYKNTMSEGEILYPPQSKFRVVAVIPPSVSKADFKMLELSKEEFQHQKDGAALVIAEKLAFSTAKSLSPEHLKSQLAKAYKDLTGKKLPDQAGLDAIKKKHVDADNKQMANFKANEKAFKASNGKNRKTNWVIQLEEI